MDSRVQDYLDDKLQSPADLESLDALLANVHEQQALLTRQLDDARREHGAAQEAAHQHAQSIQRQASEFHATQADIDRRLRVVTRSDTSDEAVQLFHQTMERLGKLELAAGYVGLLEEVDVLRRDGVSKLGQDDDAALVPYQRLQQLAARLQPLQENAEGAAPHLLDHIYAAVEDVGRTIRTAFSQNLEQMLGTDKLDWPRATGLVPAALQKDWAINVGRLLDLQMGDLEAEEQRLGKDRCVEPSPLLPLQVLVHPLHQRFTYHFSGNKPTNRLDKPEYFLNHITELVAQYSDFVQDNLQPILLKHFRRSALASTPAYIDATSALITALLPMTREKLSSVAGQVASQPALLSHLVQEVIRFDNILKDSYCYAPVSPSTDWRGLSFFLLDTCGYFEKWLAAERDFAVERYQAIVDAPDAGEIDFDSTGSDMTKPSRAALRLNDLLETITERYRDLSSYTQRIDFLMGIQITIFDTYHRRLQEALDVYLSLTSTIGRAVRTASKEELANLQGVKGLDRICRIFGSADYLERAMRDWSDDVFFIELWAELDYRSKHRDSGVDRLSSWQETRQKTGTVLGPEHDGGCEGALFDETANSYRRLRTRAEKVLVDAIKYDVQNVLKPYTVITTWASLSSSAASDAAVPAELEPALNLLSEYFGFLRKALGKAPLRRVTRQVCGAIDDYLFRYVLHGKSRFSTAGATRLTADLRALCATIDRYVGPGQAQIGMARLLEGVTLLALPVGGEMAVEGVPDDDSAWDDDDDATHHRTGGTMGLFQVERLVFTDNQGARHALEQLGLAALSEQDARSILRQRIEISS